MLLISDEYEPLQKSLAQFNFDEYFEDMYKVNLNLHVITISNRQIENSRG
jgi:hypothetical protein